MSSNKEELKAMNTEELNGKLEEALEEYGNLHLQQATRCAFAKYAGKLLVLKHFYVRGN